VLHGGCGGTFVALDDVRVLATNRAVRRRAANTRRSDFMIAFQHSS